MSFKKSSILCWNLGEASSLLKKRLICSLCIKTPETGGLVLKHRRQRDRITALVVEGRVEVLQRPMSTTLKFKYLNIVRTSLRITGSTRVEDVNLNLF